jgi:hypothetical protein
MLKLGLENNFSEVRLDYGSFEILFAILSWRKDS